MSDKLQLTEDELETLMSPRLIGQTLSMSEPQEFQLIWKDAPFKYRKSRDIQMFRNNITEYEVSLGADGRITIIFTPVKDCYDPE